MKVYINGRFLCQTVTGVQRAALETLKALDRLVAEGDQLVASLALTVLVPRSARPAPDLLQIPVRRVGILQGHAWEQLELPLYSRSGVLVSLANAAPVVRQRQCVTIHDAAVFAVPNAYSPAYRAWYRMLLPALGQRANRILTDSHFSRGELVRHAGIREGNIRVVPLGCEHILASPSDESILTDHGLTRGQFVLAVSSHSPHKNLQALCDAAKLIDGRALQIVVAGGANVRVFGPLAASWGDQVKLLGYVSDGQLRALYSHAACFAYPSLYEGFGLPPLEAMACGCPVVVSNAASLPEVCGEAAVYCDPRDPSDLARSITRVTEDNELQLTLRSRGLQRAGTFTWERSARALIEALPEGQAA